MLLYWNEFKYRSVRLLVWFLVMNHQCAVRGRSNERGNVYITWHGDAFVQPLLLWKSNKYCILCVCVCTAKYPACSAHAPYCHLWPAPLYNIFPTLSHNQHDFLKQKQRFTEHKMCVLIFWTTSVWNIYHSKKNSARCDQKCISVFM